MKPIKLPRLLYSLALPLAVGGVSALLSGPFSVYRDFNRPPGSPPAILFPIVWTILYILMGIAFYRIGDPRNFGNDTAKRNYYIQLALNFMWSIIFFRFRLFVGAALWLIALILAIIATYYEFKRFDKPAAYLLIPYILWCVYALYLNLGIAVLN